MHSRLAGRRPPHRCREILDCLMSWILFFYFSFAYSFLLSKPNMNKSCGLVSRDPKNSSFFGKVKGVAEESGFFGLSQGTRLRVTEIIVAGRCDAGTRKSVMPFLLFSVKTSLLLYLQSFKGSLAQTPRVFYTAPLVISCHPPTKRLLM